MTGNLAEMSLFHAGPVAEQLLLLENISTSVLVGPEQLPSLHKLLLVAADILEMDAPDLYIKQVRRVLLHHSSEQQFAVV